MPLTGRGRGGRSKDGRGGRGQAADEGQEAESTSGGGRRRHMKTGQANTKERDRQQPLSLCSFCLRAACVGCACGWVVGEGGLVECIDERADMLLWI